MPNAPKRKSIQKQTTVDMTDNEDRNPNLWKVRNVRPRSQDFSWRMIQAL